MQAHAVWHDDYYGTVSEATIQVDNPDPLHIWQRATGIDDREPQTITEGNIEDWDAYGSHHNGMITRIWWGDEAKEKATACYDELVAKGITPESVTVRSELYKGYRISHQQPGRGDTRPLKYAIYVTTPTGSGLYLGNDLVAAQVAVDEHLTKQG